MNKVVKKFLSDTEYITNKKDLTKAYLDLSTGTMFWQIGEKNIYWDGKLYYLSIDNKIIGKPEKSLTGILSSLEK